MYKLYPYRQNISASRILKSEMVALEKAKNSISLQANYKIQAAKLYYEVYSLSQRLRLTTIRVEHEESVRCSISDHCLSFFICSHLQLSTIHGQVESTVFCKLAKCTSPHILFFSILSVLARCYLIWNHLFYLTDFMEIRCNKASTVKTLLQTVP